MLQQINFYKLLPKQSQFQLTRKVMLSIYGVFIISLLLIYGVELHAKHGVFLQYTLLNNQVSVLQQRLTILTKQYPMSDAIALKTATQTLEEQLSNKAKTLNSLANKTDFSAYLLGLANTDVQGVWLTEIAFNNDDQKIELKGFALQSELVETILAQLSSQSAFSTFKFEVQNITENPLPLRFEIAAKQKVL